MSKKNINIQKEIEKILNEEFQQMLKENSKDPLFQLLRNGDLDPDKDINLDSIRQKICRG